MKPLKSIRVTSDGRLEGTKMEKPEETSCYKTLAKTAEQRELCRDTIHCACDQYDEALAEYESSWREFESQNYDFWKDEIGLGKDWDVKPNTIDVPKGMPMVEEVEQVFGNGKWNDRMFSGDDQKLPSRKYRTVLRFVSEGMYPKHLSDGDRTFTSEEKAEKEPSDLDRIVDALEERTVEVDTHIPIDKKINFPDAIHWMEVQFRRAMRDAIIDYANDIVNPEMAFPAKWFSENKPLILAHMDQYVKEVSGPQSEEAEESWISVKDRLPEDYKNVLFLNCSDEIPYPTIQLGYFVPSQSKIPDHITHWQPLPEPPK